MKTHSKHIFSFLIGLLLLTSLSGIRIYSHHCEESGYVKSSVFEHVANCNHKENLACKTEKKECCSKSEEVLEEKTVNDCCNTEERQIKLKVDFELISHNQKVNPHFDYVELDISSDKEENTLNNTSLSEKAKVFQPPSGKQLLLLIQNLKTEPNPYC